MLVFYRNCDVSEFLSREGTYINSVIKIFHMVCPFDSAICASQ